MPSHSHVLNSYSPEEFCEALRELRERQGITLDKIAEATKIPVYLFEGLEHNDLRRWPHGLFRRSFFRDYAKAIGLPVAEACAEFVRLFPDAAPAEVPVETPAATPEQPQPLTQAVDAVVGVWKRIANEMSQMSQRLKSEPGKDDDEPKTRKWVSDARRVGPGAPRIRVRIKVPR